MTTDHAYTLAITAAGIVVMAFSLCLLAYDILFEIAVLLGYREYTPTRGMIWIRNYNKLRRAQREAKCSIS